MAAESVDVRLARLEGSYFEERFARGDARMDRQFSWVVGLIVLSLLIPVALRFLALP